ncbi:globin domain-containing protein [Kocuria sp.]|uniref:globin domain-containing protein n=1 Tax=Kocuria sp. TaxID=1871328 RepID=UPI0026E0707D|nr:globin domain-containing protein [Kocuria sp.]MDO5619010.1 globin domain-containing protein [Kocuria sp.]
MLSEKSKPLIEATAPVIVERLPEIAPKFYQSMFEAHPELLNGVFSRANQKSGAQPLTLAGSVIAFAQHLLTHPDSYPDEMLSRVAHKHTSLGIVESQYPIVHDHLLGAIAADLGDALTPEIAAAWDEVYWLMAEALLKLERGLYASQTNNVMFAPYRLAERTETGGDTVVLTFEPADDTPQTPSVPGQYVSLQVRMPDGIDQPRQFTLIPGPEGTRRVAVKKDMDGEVSPVLHALEVGAELPISNPYGDVVLTDSDAPLVFLSAGIGVTPMVAFLDKLAVDGSSRQVRALRVDPTDADAPLLAEQTQAVAQLANGTLERWTTQSEEGDHTGRPDFSALGVTPDSHVYLCGRLEFMQDARSALVEAGVPGQNIRYEIFGPDLWMLHDDAARTQPA